MNMFKNFSKGEGAIGSNGIPLVDKSKDVDPKKLKERREELLKKEQEEKIAKTVQMLKEDPRHQERIKKAKGVEMSGVNSEDNIEGQVDEMVDRIKKGSGQKGPKKPEKKENKKEKIDRLKTEKLARLEGIFDRASSAFDVVLTPENEKEEFKVVPPPSEDENISEKFMRSINKVLGREKVNTEKSIEVGGNTFYEGEYVFYAPARGKEKECKIEKIDLKKNTISLRDMDSSITLPVSIKLLQDKLSQGNEMLSKKERYNEEESEKLWQELKGLESIYSDLKFLTGDLTLNLNNSGDLKVIKNIINSNLLNMGFDKNKKHSDFAQGVSNEEIKQKIEGMKSLISEMREIISKNLNLDNVILKNEDYK